MGRKRKANSFVAGMNGPACPRCQTETEIRQHQTINDKLLNQPFYYSEWYVCKNAECKTTLIMPDEKRVFKEQKDQDSAYSLKLIQDQLTPPWEQ